MEDSASVVIQVDWSQIISLIGGLATLIGSMILMSHRRIIRKIIFIEAWQAGFEHVYSKRNSENGNGQIADEIREERNKKLEEWKFKHLIKG